MRFDIVINNEDDFNKEICNLHNPDVTIDADNFKQYMMVLGLNTYQEFFNIIYKSWYADHKKGVLAKLHELYGLDYTIVRDRLQGKRPDTLKI